MKKIAIVNKKGGVGKTTTVFNLSWYFAKKGLKVLAIDTDAQINLTLGFGANNYKDYPTLGDYLLKRITDFKPIEIEENLHLITGTDNTEDDMLQLKNKDSAYYKALDRFLSKLEDKYDAVLIDTAPGFNAYTTSAIFTSSVYVVLVPGGFELLGLRSTIDFIRNLTDRDLKGIILIKKEHDDLSKDTEKFLETEYGEYLLKTIIRKNVDLSKCVLQNKCIFDYRKNSHGAKDYTKIAEEILEREGLVWRKKKN